MIKLILEHLRYQGGRAALTLLCVAIAFLTFGMLGTLRYSLDSGDPSVSEQRLIVTHRAGLMEPLPFASARRLAEIAGVARVGHATWTGTYFREPRNLLMAFAVDPGAWLAQHPDMVVASDARQRFMAAKNGMLVSAPLAAKLGWHIGDPVPLQSILYMPGSGQPAWSYTLSGVFTSSDSGGGRNYIVTHYNYLNDNRNLWKDMVGTFMVTPKPGVSADALARRIDEAFAQSPYPTATTTDRAFHAAFFAQFGDVLAMIKAVTATTLVSLVLIVASSMALSIRQRSRDIGVLRVIGFSGWGICRLVYGQTGLLMLAGAGLGLGAAAVANHWLTRRMPEYLPDITMPVPVIGQAMLVAAGITLVAAIFPALVALWVRPVQAFRMEQG